MAIEKNEQKRIRELMAQNTPKKSSSSQEQEILALKEEIKTKTGEFGVKHRCSFLIYKYLSSTQYTGFPSLFAGITFLKNLHPRIPKPLF